MNLDPSQSGLDGANHGYEGTTLVTNGWEGPTIQRLIATFAKDVRSDGFDAAKVPVIGIGASNDGRRGYPAVTAWREVYTGVLMSAEKGAAAGLDRISSEKSEEREKGCAEPKFIVTGYSQGAMAARLIAQASKSVVGVVDVGDPFQKPNSPGNEGSAKDGNGFIRWNYPAYQGTWDKFYASDARKSAICHEGDPICSYSWLGGPGAMIFAVGPHTTYGTINNEAASKGKELADLAHEYFNKTAPPAPRAALDTVFAIDTTGSMSPYIQGAVEIAAETGAKTLAAATDGRVGVVEYRDHGDGFVARQVVPLTSDINAFTAGLDSLGASGGGDLPESVYSGLVTALASDWNPEAARQVVVVGDAPAHDPEPVTGYTASQIQRMFLGTELVPMDPGAGLRSTDESGSEADRAQEPTVAKSGPESESSARSNEVVEAAVGEPLVGLPITLYSLSASSELTDQLAPIAAATGGLALDISNPDEVGDRIIESLEDAISAPEADVVVSPLATVGIPVFISAVESTVSEGNAQFDFDLDNDGIYETPSDTGVIEHTFSAPGTATVGVRVTDTRGRSAIVSTEVVVQPASAAIPLFATDTPASEAIGISLSATSVPSGSTITLTTTNLVENEAYGARLVERVTGADSYLSSPVATYGAFQSGALNTANTTQLAIAVPAGAYDLVVVTEAGRRTLTPLDVTADGAVTPTPTPTGTSTQAPTSVPSGAASQRETVTLAATGVDAGAALLAGLLLLGAGVAASISIGLRRKARY